MRNGTSLLARCNRKHWVWPAMFSVVAFAANSIFCRLALMNGDVDPGTFTTIRLVSGGLFLLLLIKLRRPARPLGGSWKGGISLFVYAYLFSIAYIQLGAGVGALILFGSVQIAMFAFAWVQGERFQAQVLLGMLMAFAGLVALLLPGAQAPPLVSALVMIVSGVAWGAYSLIGRGSVNPLADTAGNFIRSWPLVLFMGLILSVVGQLYTSLEGSLYALGSGVLASGAGYAVWYGVVKQISAQQAATLQLSVPILAALGGVLLLSEPMSMRLIITSGVVLSGVAIALMAPRLRPDRAR
ncbi:DMT family transporter [Pseudomonas saliphila]|uniref:DMT family transporter n=1 Tax=Pseudomonas saliphila TaxID=2586906 RepID=UPI0012389B57|nr:DMT family transporter [Pseudomonas saliphila]